LCTGGVLMGGEWYAVSLMTLDNEYQVAQRAAAAQMAQKLGVQVEYFDAENDAVTQTQQILSLVQRKNSRPRGVICVAVGSGMPQVALEAAKVGIDWAIINRDVDYLENLRNRHGVIAFSLRQDDVEIGRLMGRQVSALRPKGLVIHLCGPSSSDVMQQRERGFSESKPAGLSVRTLYGKWTRESGHHCIDSLLHLSTTQSLDLDMVVSQNDDMAAGARDAFSRVGERWRHVRYVGVDGLPDRGQSMVDRGHLSATVVAPTMIDRALEMMVSAEKSGRQPLLHTLVTPSSYPEISRLN